MYLEWNLEAGTTGKGLVSEYHYCSRPVQEGNIFNSFLVAYLRRYLETQYAFDPIQFPTAPWPNAQAKFCLKSPDHHQPPRKMPFN